MNQDFSFSFNRMRENNPTNPVNNAASESKTGIARYDTIGNSRNLGLAWPDGRKIFLNYSYLVSGEYSQTEQTITLAFTSHLIVLKGIMLDELFSELMMHIPKMLVCMEARYISLQEKDQIAITQIEVQKIGD